MPGVRRRIEFEGGYEEQRGRSQNRRRDDVVALEDEIARLSALSEELTVILLRERIALAEGIKRALEAWKEELEQIQSGEKVENEEAKP